MPANIPTTTAIFDINRIPRFLAEGRPSQWHHRLFHLPLIKTSKVKQNTSSAYLERPDSVQVI